MSFKSQYFLLVINSNLGPISHRLVTIHSWQTNRRRRTTTMPKTATA